ncbi:MAG TPA: mechanosensitive ion channel domain-containing protein [Pseudomonadales bacterium]
MEFVNDLLRPLEGHPWALALVQIAALLLIVWFVNKATHSVLRRAINRALGETAASGLIGRGIFRRLANVVPALVAYYGVGLITGLPEPVVVVVRNVASAFVVLALALALTNLMTALGDVYDQRDPERARARPIKGYLQVAKIVVYFVAAILIVATLFDRSPLLLLSGLGAMTAVLMLVFKDTLLSLVASVQLSSNDMLRIGDWIVMPQLNADGFVVDISLHTVKVQNWDRTITTIPTWRLINESYINWRGMFESGGRQIKRAIYLDQASVRFLTDQERESLRRLALIRDYLDRKQREIDEHNARLAAEGKDPINARRVTNVGTFRAYVQAYIDSHPQIHQGMIRLVRQLQPGPTGLPLQIYCYTSDTAWVAYEGIQADIFDHLYAILPEFGLRVFQQPSGADIALALAAHSDGAAVAEPTPRAALTASES